MISGIFALNLVCRDSALKEEILRRLKNSFSVIFVYDIPEEVNEVVFCSDDTKLNRETLRGFLGASDALKYLKLY